MIFYSTSNAVSLENKNTGDLHGAAGSLCDAISDSTLRNADFVSLSQVQVNNSWGQVKKI